MRPRRRKHQLEMRRDSIVLILFEREFAPLTTGGREFRGLPGEGVMVYQADDNLQATPLMGGDNAVEGSTVGVLQTIEGGITAHVTVDSRSIVPDVDEMSATSAASLIHNKGLVLNFTTPPGSNLRYSDNPQRPGISSLKAVPSSWFRM
jgi:hypothetical protein